MEMVLDWFIFFMSGMIAGGALLSSILKDEEKKKEIGGQNGN